MFPIRANNYDSQKEIKEKRRQMEGRKSKKNEDESYVKRLREKS